MHPGGLSEAPVQQSLQRLRLLPRQPVQRRAAPDHFIVFADLLCTQPGNQAAEPVPGDALQRNVDDGRIHEQVIEEGLHILHTLGPAQIEQYYSDRFAGIDCKRGRWKIISADQPLVVSVVLQKLPGRHDLTFCCLATSGLEPGGGCQFRFLLEVSHKGGDLIESQKFLNRGLTRTGSAFSMLKHNEKTGTLL